MKKIIHFANRGQSIIEVVVALALIAVVVLGLVKVTIISINNASFARDQQGATKYAQEGIENARKLKKLMQKLMIILSGKDLLKYLLTMNLLKGMQRDMRESAK